MWSLGLLPLPVDELVWVTIGGKAAILLALCLHSAVDELLCQHSNKPTRKPSENVNKGHREASLMRAKIMCDPKHR